MTTSSELRAPFPWTGGKSWVAEPIWEALGDVTHYIEPFGGSAAVLLARPHRPTMETVNDLNHYLINFWRAVKRVPQEVAHYAINPLAEADLYARNAALVRTSDEFRQKMLDDPEFFDPKIAGWWVWGQSTLIGRTFANDICRKMPSLSHMGINALTTDPESWLQALASRLQKTRILYGDWKRCLGATSIGLNPSPRVKTVGVFLDPPYHEGDYKYADSEPHNVWEDARQWAVDHGEHRKLRIILAGYADDKIKMPDGWRLFSWQGHGGLGRKSGANTNRNREVLWMSPHCLEHHSFQMVDLLEEEETFQASKVVEVSPVDRLRQHLKHTPQVTLEDLEAVFFWPPAHARKILRALSLKGEVKKTGSTWVRCKPSTS